jgi:pimeloyl-ACP methyl ester carboxylesterase
MKDLICGFGPEEWPRCSIVVGDEGGDGQLQFLDAAMNAAADLALGQKREPALDLIEPGGVRRRLGRSWFAGQRLRADDAGGTLAQTFAFQFPKRCRKLVLASTSPGVFMVPGRLGVLTKLLSARRYADPHFLHKFGAEIYGGAYRHQPDLIRNHSRAIQPPSYRGYLCQLMAVSGWTSLPWLPLLKQPTLIMHGIDDPIVPLINAKILSICIRRAELHVINDGHLFIVSRAKEVAAIVARFLAKDP